ARATASHEGGARWTSAASAGGHCSSIVVAVESSARLTSGVSIAEAPVARCARSPSSRSPIAAIARRRCSETRSRSQAPLRSSEEASMAPGDVDRTRPARRSSPARQPFLLEAQRALRDLGYDPGPIDGIFGPRTRAALEKYQTTERLPATGVLDGLTPQRLHPLPGLFRPPPAPRDTRLR